MVMCPLHVLLCLAVAETGPVVEDELDVSDVVFGKSREVAFVQPWHEEQSAAVRFDPGGPKTTGGPP